MTLSFKEFVCSATPKKKRQKFGLGQGLYGGIEPLHKGGGKFLFWRNSRYEKRIGILSKFTEKKARRKVAEFQSLVDQGMNPNSITKKKSKDTKTFNHYFLLYNFVGCECFINIQNSLQISYHLYFWIQL